MKKNLITGINSYIGNSFADGWNSGLTIKD